MKDVAVIFVRIEINKNNLSFPNHTNSKKFITETIFFNESTIGQTIAAVWFIRNVTVPFSDDWKSQKTVSIFVSWLG